MHTKIFTAFFLFLSTMSFAQNIPSYVPKDGLVGYWPFNGNANDESGNGNNGVVNGAALTTNRDGIVNSAYNFNGIDQYIDCGDNSSLNFTNDFTMACWAKTSTNYQNCGILGRWNNPASLNNSHYLLYFSDNNVGSCVGLPNTYANKSFYYANDIWIHYVVKFEHNILYLYIDNQLVSQTSFTGTLSSVKQKFVIGAYSFDSIKFISNNLWNGQIDDVVCYKRALTEQEISNLYLGCSHEAASSNLGNSLYLTSDKGVDLVASPAGGTFSGGAVKQGKFEPTSAKIGVNKVVYNYKNSAGCEDVTEFKLVVADTNGTVCKFTDTVKVVKTETKYDTVIVKNNVYDTVIVNKTKFDTITITNKVTKYDTVLVNKYDTITINKTVVDTLIVKNNIYDTVKVTKYDTVTFKNTIYDTILVNKYDTITTMDTVSILKINFKLTTGIYANQMTSMSLYPNPTSDILHIEVGDVKGLEGYRYRIMDALGKEVYNELVKTAITEIPLKTLGAAGMYLFEVLDTKNSSIQSNKIVLQ